MAKLSKFPVTASDGAEYRVTITEYESDAYSNAYAIVRLYKERENRRFFRFKRLCKHEYHEGRGVYLHDRPDYVSLAKQALSDYEEYLVWLAEDTAKKTREVDEKARHRAAATEAFTAWDGTITDEGAV